MTERNEKGQFVAGNPGGPGRPRKPTADNIPTSALLDLIAAGEGSMYLTAMALHNQNDLDSIRQTFPAEIVGKIEMIIQTSKLANAVLLKRLRAELEQ